MKYPYYDLYDKQFEKLVVGICLEILGQGTQEFSSGKDGGRDARFIGKANSYPSNSSPYSGKFIIQAKHSEHPFSKVSDSSFSSTAKTSIISMEIEKIKMLKFNDELDHYLLFTNRRCPADATIAIENRIKKETQISSTCIVGVEKIETWLKVFPRVAIAFNLEPIEAPLRVSPDEIAEVITKLSKQNFKHELKKITNIQRVKFKEKNKKNKLSEDYEILIKKRIKDFGPIKNFLSDPQNQKITALYISASEEFQSAFISHKADFKSFDLVLDYFFRQLVDKDSDISRNRSLTRAVLFYMYWNCDLGID